MASPRAVVARRLTIGILAVLAVLSVGASLYVRSVTNRFDESLTYDADVSAELEGRIDDRVNVLVIGSDSRENLPDDLDGNFGSFGGRRADVVMLVSIDTANASAQLISFPRDLKVELGEHGTQKLNAAYAFGGGALAVKTMREVTGVPINHYVEVDFAGFAGIVDALGGLEMEFEYPARDLKSGLDVPAGAQTVDGATALAYVRSRQYQEFRDGAWVSSSANDIGRMGRQQDAMRLLAAQAKRPGTVLEAGDLAEAVGRFLTVDQNLDSGTIVQLVWAMRDLQPENLEMATLPTHEASSGGAYYEAMTEPEAGLLLAAFAQGTSFTAPVMEPARVQVLNGTGEPGAAARLGEALESGGFQVISLADAADFNHTTTSIVVDTGKEEYGRELRAFLNAGEVTVAPLPIGIDVIITVGFDIDP